MELLLEQGIQDEIAALKEELKEKEKNVPQLQKKLEELPILLEKARDEGAKECKKEMEEENAHTSELFKRESDSAYEALELQLKNIKLDNDELQAEKEAIRVKLDKAYDESN